MRFKTFRKAKFLHKAGHQSEFPRKCFISCKEINQAPAEVVKLLQKEAFKDIRTKLNNREAFLQNRRCGFSLGKAPPRSLRELRPIIVCDVYCFGGRLQHASLPVKERHPDILPSRHHVANLIVQYCHGIVGHSDVQAVLSVVREQVWIIKGKFPLWQCLHERKSCRFWKPKTCKKLMAPLIKCRVSANNAPFTCTGADYFGALLLKVGRSRVKRYGWLFTCMTTRAVHFKIAGSLKASSLLSAFFRFIQRRGPVKEMYSNRGTNFVLAERDLRNGIMHCNQQKIHDSMSKRSAMSTFATAVSGLNIIVSWPGLRVSRIASSNLFYFDAENKHDIFS